MQKPINPTGPLADRQPAVAPYDRDIHHLWAYIDDYIKYGDRAEQLPMEETALVIHGLFAEAQEAVQQWRADTMN
jgi:hypothetical protein